MFIEERIREEILYGSSYSEEYSVEISQTDGGGDFRRLRYPYPRLRYNLELLDDYPDMRDEVIGFFHKTGGAFGGFRLKHKQDYSTNDYTGVPTFNDQQAELVSTGIYQITRWYGTEGDSTAARRRIKKPVTGSILVGIRDYFNNPVQLTQGFTASDTTGQVTFSANKTGTVTNITVASEAVISITAHPFTVGDSVHVSGVVGMIEINGLRGTVTAISTNTITTDIDTTGFTAYDSAGAVNTNPQSNEEVTAGCYYDIPVRFETQAAQFDFTNYNILESSISIVEIFNP